MSQQLAFSEGGSPPSPHIGREAVSPPAPLAERKHDPALSEGAGSVKPLRREPTEGARVDVESAQACSVESKRVDAANPLAERKAAETPVVDAGGLAAGSEKEEPLLGDGRQARVSVLRTQGYGMEPERPAWHSVVYGAEKNPIHSVRPIKRAS